MNRRTGPIVWIAIALAGGYWLWSLNRDQRALLDRVAPEVEAQAPQLSADEAAALANADAILEAITAGDGAAMADLMHDSGVLVVTGPEPATWVSATSMGERVDRGGIVERGWDPEVRVKADIATVWYPYDLYLDGEWSHCGIDSFQLVRVDGVWKTHSLIFTREQPPACEPHPDGPPEGMVAPGV